MNASPPVTPAQLMNVSPPIFVPSRELLDTTIPGSQKPNTKWIIP
jgi:hypothetical protein